MLIPVIPNCLIYLYSGIDNRQYLVSLKEAPFPSFGFSSFPEGHWRHTPARLNDTALALESRAEVRRLKWPPGLPNKGHLDKTEEQKGERDIPAGNWAGQRTFPRLVDENSHPGAEKFKRQDFYSISCKQKYLPFQVLVNATGMGSGERTIGLYQYEDGKTCVTKPGTAHTLTMCTCLPGMELHTARTGQQHAWWRLLKQATSAWSPPSTWKHRLVC